jgi:hypothetical protein
MLESLVAMDSRSSPRTACEIPPRRHPSPGEDLIYLFSWGLPNTNPGPKETSPAQLPAELLVIKWESGGVERDISCQQVLIAIISCKNNYMLSNTGYRYFFLIVEFFVPSGTDLPTQREPCYALHSCPCLSRKRVTYVTRTWATE